MVGPTFRSGVERRDVVGDARPEGRAYAARLRAARIFCSALASI